MLGLFLLFSLLGISGIALESRLPFNDLPRRLVIVLTTMAAQLLLAIQALSLAVQLTAVNLLLANLLFTVVVVVITQQWESNPARQPWQLLLKRAAGQAGALRSPITWAMVIIAFVAVTLHCVLGAFVIPFGDSYHFEMPAFWMQHRTIAPFPASNPRLVTVSFLAEALSLPGYLFSRTPMLFAVLTCVAALFTLMIIFSLARRTGASTAAAGAAAALTTGYSIFLPECRDSHAAVCLSGMWFGASLLFLISCHKSEEIGASLGSAGVCFFMACGAKNSTALLAPVIGVLAMLMLGRSILTWRATLAGLAAVMLGLLASGVAWNYVQNKSWFGDPRGPEFLRGHLAADFQPRSVYTRFCRGGVLLVGDAIWIPRSWQPKYGALGKSAVRWLGGRDVIRDDGPPSSFAGIATGCHFSEASITPRKGLGLAGLIFFLPGLMLAGWRCARADGDPRERRNVCGLLFVTIGVFLLSHTFLRWQAVGLLRLVPAFWVAGAPLAALVLEAKFSRTLALVILGMSVAALSFYCIGTAARRLDAVLPLPGWVVRLQNAHQQTVQIELPGQPRESLLVKEDYTRREIYERMWRELPQPTVVGMVGNYDSEFYYLFGCGFVNRVVSLRDTRVPDALLAPPADLQILVLADDTAECEAWARARHFEPVLQVYDGDRCVFGAFKKQTP